jgi:two-component system, LytTR family, sensor kinase
MSRKYCFERAFGFNDKWVLIAGIPISAIIVSLMLFNEYFAKGDFAFLSVCIPISAIYTTTFWFTLRWTYVRVKVWHPGIDDLGRRLGWMGISLVIIFLVVNLVLDNVIQWLVPAHQGPPNVTLEFISTMLLTALVCAIYESISFYTQLQKTIAEKTQLERQHVQSQLEGLRNQVNPHFLFNSLNTLVYLIPEDSDKAVRFVQKLSKVYRYVLESRDANAICLHDELDYLNAYIFLLRERFGDNLKVDIRDLERQTHAKIVPLTFQMLLENAIKHNVISTEKPLRIEISHENGHIVVRNNLQLKNQVMDSTGVGLENIRERYRLLMEKEIQVVASHQFFTVLIPI